MTHDNPADDQPPLPRIRTAPNHWHLALTRHPAPNLTASPAAPRPTGRTPAIDPKS
ncbi:hypothetical protein AB0D10_01200 [Kitasatospora sp. NPDC048545]|uniref:hypothetical protein n=1 Tax=Kitasatospora sp. NPDC048545 TaxID=3157208 RepID=UPI0033E5AC84